MQVANPQYKYYKKLAGTWVNADRSCMVKPDTYANIEIRYGDAFLSKSYSVTEGVNMMMGMMMSDYQPRPGEELRILVFDAKLAKDGKDLYQVNCIWYGSETIYLELTDISSGQTQTIELKRDTSGAAAASTPGSYTCECGVTFTSKFCPNCGALRKEETTYTCECGYTGPVRNFCPNCGKSIEEEITCECGYKCKGVKFCPNCGKPTGAVIYKDSMSVEPVQEQPAASLTPAEPEVKLGWKCPKCGASDQEWKCAVCGADIIPVPLFGIMTYQSTNPPVTTHAGVYEYSETRLLFDNNGERRLISTDVIEPAMEIIRKNRLDDKDFKDPMPIMGGSVYVGYKDGDSYVQSSLQEKGYAVTTAQGELMNLFNNA